MVTQIRFYTGVIPEKIYIEAQLRFNDATIPENVYMVTQIVFYTVFRE